MSVFRFIKWIDEGKPLELFGDGTQSRDFTYVDDIARGTILAGRLVGGRMTDGARSPASDTIFPDMTERVSAEMIKPQAWPRSKAQG